MTKYNNTINITIDNDTLERYNKYYFKMYPRRKKKPIDRPIHPLMNRWMIMPRPQMNALKQTWCEFIIWLITKDLGLKDSGIEDCEMEFKSYMPTRRRVDCDGLTPKFILDGLTKAGLIVDDDCLHLKKLSLGAGHDPKNPRTEIKIFYNEKKEN